MLIGTLVGEGQRIPWGWGIAYRDFDRDAKVAYPIPVHFLVRWARDLRFWLMTVGRPGHRERIEQAAYNKGWSRSLGYIEREGDAIEQRAFTKGWNAALKKCLDDLDKQRGASANDR